MNTEFINFEQKGLVKNTKPFYLDDFWNKFKHKIVFSLDLFGKKRYVMGTLESFNLRQGEYFDLTLSNYKIEGVQIQDPKEHKFHIVFSDINIKNPFIEYYEPPLLSSDQYMKLCDKRKEED